MRCVRIAVLGLCLFACSSTKSGTGMSEPVAAPGTGDWATWSHEKKMAYMKSTVLPRAQKLFAAFDPVRYADATCETCHGSGAVDATYKMPNPDLAKWPGGADAFRELAQKDPKMLTFMQQVLVPATAELLAVKPFDMASHTGFSCFHCHVRGEYVPSR